MDHPKKAQALADILGHLQQYGSKNWGCLRSRIDFVGQNTFWRWVREVKKGEIGRELRAGSARRRGGEPRFDFLGADCALWGDAMKLRSHAMHLDGNVRNPALLDRSIRIRLKLLRQGLELEARIYSAGAQRAFYDGLVAEIAAESPVLRERLMNHLRGFSSEFDQPQAQTS
jgi:hypothetical protein